MMIWLAELDWLTVENIERVGVPGTALVLLILVIGMWIRLDGKGKELKALTEKIEAETDKTRAETERRREEQFLLTIGALAEGVGGIRRAVEAMPAAVSEFTNGLKSLQATTTDLQGLSTTTNTAVNEHHHWAETSVKTLVDLSQEILAAVQPLPAGLGEIKGQLLHISSQLLALAIVKPVAEDPAPPAPPAEAAP